MGFQGIEPWAVAASVRRSTAELKSLLRNYTKYITVYISYNYFLLYPLLMQHIDKYLEATIAKVFLTMNFEGMNEKALFTLKETFKIYLDSNCKIIGRIANHSGRNDVSLFDFYRIQRKIQVFNYDVVNVLGIDDKLKYEQIILKDNWISPLGIKSDRFIHIYDFMPEFPAIHTFRNTTLVESKEGLESINVKSRIDQSVKSEKNMFKLFKTSESLPPFINCMYRTMNFFNKNK